MRLAKLDGWRHKVVAEDSMPTWHTALRWAKAGKIPGAVHVHGAWPHAKAKAKEKTREVAP